MSLPRQVVPGTTYVVARRCVDQRFLLRPDTLTTRIVTFLLAYFAAKYGILLHGFAFMSNHFHLVLTDPEGKLPFFMAQFQAQVSRTLNRSRGRKGRFWESTPYSALPIKTREDLHAQLAYVAANPVAAGGVKKPSRWPGLISTPDSPEWSRPTVIARPPLYGRKTKSSLPEKVELRLHLPKNFEKERASFFNVYRATLRSTLIDTRRSVKHFLGAKAVRRMSPNTIPSTADLRATFDRRPALANATKQDRIDLRAWRDAYRKAIALWPTDKTVEFPHGTFLVVKIHGARVAPPPPS